MGHRWPSGGCSHYCRVVGNLGCGVQPDPRLEQPSHILIARTNARRGETQTQAHQTLLYLQKTILHNTTHLCGHTKQNTLSAGGSCAVSGSSYNELLQIHSQRTEKFKVCMTYSQCAYSWGCRTEDWVDATVPKCLWVFVVHVVLPTRMRVSLDSTVPDYKATSCSVNVRGEVKSCILGILEKYWTW